MSEGHEVFLRKREVSRRVGLAVPTIYRKIQEGTFPRPVRLSERASAWPASEVDRWMRERVAERDAGRGEAA
jgi:prophage regulatory protein